MDRFPSSLATFPGRLRTAWSGQSSANRLAIVLVAAAVAVTLGVFGAFRLHGPDYGVLFSNLSPDEANAVVQKLDAEKIPHRLSADGTTVLIPQENVSDERVALAGSGVVKTGGGTGFELFDRTNLGMTDFQEKIAKVRATEGELQRTIAGLGPVESARVHIAIPERTLYSSSQDPTTASIAIRSKPGMQLSPAEVRGITSLVSGAVEGLKPENVTIVNQDGNVLVPSAAGNPAEAAGAASALGLTQDQLVAKQRYESNLQSNVQSLLDAAIGGKRSAVRVATEMDFDANSTETKSYAPAGTVRSQQTERENYSGAQPPKGTASGVPGTTTNVVPTYQGLQQNGQSGRYGRTKSTTNYEITESKTTHVDAPGKVKRVSVAVLVNVPAPAAGAAPASGNPYTVAPADVAKIRNVVAAAAGLDESRGDRVSVEAIPFAPEPALATRTVTTVGGVPLAALIAGLVLLALGGAAAAFVLRRRAAGSADFRAVAELPTFDSSLAEELPAFEEHPMLDAAPSIAAPIRSAADLTREQMIEYVTTVAQENPESIAKLVKLWLAEA